MYLLFCKVAPIIELIIVYIIFLFFLWELIKWLSELLEV